MMATPRTKRENSEQVLTAVARMLQLQDKQQDLQLQQYLRAGDGPSRTPGRQKPSELQLLEGPQENCTEQTDSTTEIPSVRQAVSRSRLLQELGGFSDSADSSGLRRLLRVSLGSWVLGLGVEGLGSGSTCRIQRLRGPTRTTTRASSSDDADRRRSRLRRLLMQDTSRRGTTPVR